MISPHTPRHSAHEDDETTVIPAIRDDDTAYLPKQSDPPAEPVARPVPVAVVAAPKLDVSMTDTAVGLGTGGANDETAVIPAVPAESTQDTPRRVRGVLRTASHATGELLVTFGLVVLLLAAYEIWGKAALVHAQQTDLNNQLAQNWNNPAVTPSTGASPDATLPGSAIARLYIPHMQEHWVVVEGVSLKDIRYAPGHYPGTAMPGQVGNFSVAGHREWGIFWLLDLVKKGDDVIVETKTNWYIYEVYQIQIVNPHAVEVVAPVPNQPGAVPVDKDITLTTCNPKGANYQRLVVHGKLYATLPHIVRPTQLGG